MSRMKRERVRRWKRGYKYASGTGALIALLIAGALFFGVDGNGRWFALVPLWMAFMDGREAVLGKPKRWWRRKGGPFWNKERHIPDCRPCNGRGGLIKPFPISLFAYDNTRMCPDCPGSGKVRHPHNEWYYRKMEGDPSYWRYYDHEVDVQLTRHIAAKMRQEHEECGAPLPPYYGSGQAVKDRQKDAEFLNARR